MAKTDLISLRLPPDLRERLKEAAEADNRTVSNYILNLIIKALDDKERPE